MNWITEHLASWFSGDIGGPAPLPGRIIQTALVILLYVACRLLATRLTRRRIQDLAKRYVANKTILYVLGIVALVAILRIWVPATRGLATYLGIVSAGLAIALQDPLTNLAGWIFISLRKPFTVGDRIELGDHAGDVIDLRLFQFSLVEIGNWVDADQSTGRIIHIPNGWVFKHTVANSTAEFNFIWHEIPVMVTFESNWRKAKEILSTIAAEHAPVKSDDAAGQLRRAARRYLIVYQHLSPIVWTKVADSGVVLTARYLCEVRKRRSSEARMWEEILTAFAEEDDIDFAYPTQRFYHNRIEGKPGAGGEPGAEGERQSEDSRRETSD